MLATPATPSSRYSASPISFHSPSNTATAVEPPRFSLNPLPAGPSFIFTQGQIQGRRLVTYARRLVRHASSPLTDRPSRRSTRSSLHIQEETRVGDARHDDSTAIAARCDQEVASAAKEELGRDDAAKEASGRGGAANEASERDGAAHGRSEQDNAAPVDDASERDGTYAVLRILDQHSRRYHNAWADVDPATGQRYAPTWEPMQFANSAAILQWKLDKTANATSENDIEIRGIVAEDEHRFKVAWAGKNPDTGLPYPEEWLENKEDISVEALRAWEKHRTKSRHQQKAQKNRANVEKHEGRKRKRERAEQRAMGRAEKRYKSTTRRR